MSDDRNLTPTPTPIDREARTFTVERDGHVMWIHIGDDEHPCSAHCDTCHSVWDRKGMVADWGLHHYQDGE